MTPERAPAPSTTSSGPTEKHDQGDRSPIKLALNPCADVDPHPALAAGRAYIGKLFELDKSDGRLTDLEWRTAMASYIVTAGELTTTAVIDVRDLAALLHGGDTAKVTDGDLEIVRAALQRLAWRGALVVEELDQ